ncbi:septum site-determining protein MinC [Sporolactobacillus sp. Y61]|uniref:Probable septum site-determining protein MinC n=1 Tax=Sporolactobacillus sp. Y61 TaxID=3160863 RepID=A0AAU8IEE1_9BACL
MSASLPLVTMKGRKDGLVLIMDENCTYDALLQDLKEKLSVNKYFDQDDPVISVKVEAGNRYLSAAQKSELVSVIRSFDHLQVEKIETNVMTREEFEKEKSREQVVPVERMIRSGQMLTIEGNLLLIGDVNPGGRVSATGNIYILGTLRGIAAAGIRENNREAIIAASIMEPTQLRIGDLICGMDKPLSTDEDETAPKCAYIDQSHGEIVIDTIHDSVVRYHLAMVPEKS